MAGYNSDYLTLVMNVGGKVGSKIWQYDTADGNSTVYAAGYISDAKARRMEKGDIVIVRIWDTTVPVANSEKLTPDGTANDLQAIYIHWVIGINATTGAADLTNGLAITATNS